VFFVLMSGVAVNSKKTVPGISPSLSSSNAGANSFAGGVGGGAGSGVGGGGGGFGGNSPNYGSGQYPYVPTAPQGFQTPFAPQPLLGPEQFNSALQQYLFSLQQQYDALYRQQQEIINQWREAQASAYYGPNYNPNYGSNYNPNFGSNYNPNFGPNYNPNQNYRPNANYNPNPNFGANSGSDSSAYASGSYTPNEIHQTAGVFPINPASQNVDSRFGPEETDGKPGFVGISTSSFSSSSDIDGVKSHKEGAITTVNDNGKITTHKVGS